MRWQLLATDARSARACPLDTTPRHGRRSTLANLAREIYFAEKECGDLDFLCWEADLVTAARDVWLAMQAKVDSCAACSASTSAPATGSLTTTAPSMGRVSDMVSSPASSSGSSPSSRRGLVAGAACWPVGQADGAAGGRSWSQAAGQGSLQCNEASRVGGGGASAPK